MKTKIISSIFALSAFVVASPSFALTLEQRLPEDASNADAFAGEYQIQRLIQRMAVIAVMQKPSTKVYNSEDVVNGVPTNPSKGTVAGTFFNDATGGHNKAAKDPTTGIATFVKPRVYCNRVSDITRISASSGTAIYECSISVLSINVNQDSWEVQYTEQPEYSQWMTTKVKIKAESSGTTDYDSDLTQNFLTWGAAG